MRVAAYVGTSVALATSVVLRAAYERPNFYSACVYLQQSNACLMILTNLVLLCICTLLYGLQRLLYGRLRPTEIERLYEHAWFAVTETLLAMTIFRDDVGVWFFVMFVGLIAGKIWQWIGEGRVEFVEQQPPSSRVVFFHSRLASSLLLSILYDATMLQYCINTVLKQARPNMIVMFGFEFALLAIASMATFFRHILCLCDLIITHKQVEAKRMEIQAERRAERQQGLELVESSEPVPAGDPIEDEVDDNEIDVPGWEGKGRFVFYLDLATDFVKLTIYMAFFIILMTFHGLPIHIMRDVLLTLRSFHRRIYDFIRYRNATRDMNTRYPDATVEDLQNNNICIICREEMRPWSQPDQPPAAGEGIRAPPPAGRPIDERHRAKKLPCNHCLHISCLRSWLERQQACPTCRQPVLAEDSNRRTRGTNGNAPANAAGQQGQQPRPNPPGNNQHAAARGLRQFQFGPLRFAYGVLQQPAPAEPDAQQQAIQALQSVRQSLQTLAGHPPNPAQQQRQLAREALRVPTRYESVVAQARWLDQMEARIIEEIANLSLARQQLQIVRALEAEFLRLRALRNSLPGSGDAGASRVTIGPPNPGGMAVPGNLNNLPVPGDIAQGTGPPFPSAGLPNLPGMPTPGLYSNTTGPETGVGDQNIPPGLVLPPGWSMMPLQRTDQSNPVPQTPSLFQQPNPAQAAEAAHPPPNDTYTATDLNNWGDWMRRTIEQAGSREYAPNNATVEPLIPRTPPQPSSEVNPGSASHASTATSAPQEPDASGSRPLQPSVEEADDSAPEG